MDTFTDQFKDVLLDYNRAAIASDKELELDTIDDQIAWHQANRLRLAGSRYYGNMDHTFKDNGKRSNGKVCTKPHKNYDPKKSDEYDDHYYSIINLRCKKQLLMDKQAQGPK